MAAWSAEMEVDPSIFIGLGTFVAGGVANAWWSRARPLIHPVGCSTSTPPRTVDVPESLESLARESGLVPVLRAGSTKLAIASRAYGLASEVLGQLESAVDELPGMISAFKSAVSDQDQVAALEAVLTSAIMSRALADAFGRQRLTLRRDPIAGPQKVETVKSPDGPGFTIYFRDGYTTIGDEYSKGSVANATDRRIEPFVRAISVLDRELILEVLDWLRNDLPKQKVNCAKVTKSIGDLVQEKEQWTLVLDVANFGVAPLLIWPNAELEVTHRSTGARFPMDARVALETPGKPGARDLVGPQVLTSGGKVRLWAISNKAQDELADGKSIRTSFELGTGTVRCRLRLTRRGLLWRRWKWSEKFGFRSTDAPPQDDSRAGAAGAGDA
ncbi:MAG: hypothetical protein JNM10_06915 [Planctomycetia bacterium]|nr:hypothetical protein [Planctomycetia bacterium]